MKEFFEYIKWFGWVISVILLLYIFLFNKGNEIEPTTNDTPITIVEDKPDSSYVVLVDSLEEVIDSLSNNTKVVTIIEKDTVLLPSEKDTVERTIVKYKTFNKIHVGTRKIKTEYSSFEIVAKSKSPILTIGVNDIRYDWEKLDSLYKNKKIKPNISFGKKADYFIKGSVVTLDVLGVCVVGNNIRNGKFTLSDGIVSGAMITSTYLMLRRGN